MFYEWASLIELSEITPKSYLHKFKNINKDISFFAQSHERTFNSSFDESYFSFKYQKKNIFKVKSIDVLWMSFVKNFTRYVSMDYR